MAVATWTENEIPAVAVPATVAWFVATVIVTAGTVEDGWDEVSTASTSSWDECAGTAVSHSKCTVPSTAWVEKNEL